MKDPLLRSLSSNYFFPIWNRFVVDVVVVVVENWTRYDCRRCARPSRDCERRRRRFDDSSISEKSSSVCPYNLAALCRKLFGLPPGGSLMKHWRASEGPFRSFLPPEPIGCIIQGSQEGFVG